DSTGGDAHEDFIGIDRGSLDVLEFEFAVVGENECLHMTEGESGKKGGWETYSLNVAGVPPSLPASPSPILPFLKSQSLRCSLDLRHAMVRGDEERRAVFAELDVGCEVAGVEQTQLFALGRKNRHTTRDRCPQMAFRVDRHSIARTHMRLGNV